MPVLTDLQSDIGHGDSRHGAELSAPEPEDDEQMPDIVPKSSEQSSSTHQEKEASEYLRVPQEEDGRNKIWIGKEYQAEVPCGCVDCLSPVETRYDSREIFSPYFKQVVPKPTLETMTNAVMSPRDIQYIKAERRLLAEASEHARAFTEFLRCFQPSRVEEDACTSRVPMKTDKGKGQEREQISARWVQERALALLQNYQGDDKAILTCFVLWRELFQSTHPKGLEFSPIHIPQDELHEYLERCWGRAQHGTSDTGFPISKGGMAETALKFLQKERYQTTPALQKFEN